MSFLQTLFAGDDSRGKKSDERAKPTNGAILPSAWSPKKTLPPPTRRRIIYVLLALTAAYFFVKNLPSDQGPVNAGRPMYGRPPPFWQSPRAPEQPLGGPVSLLPPADAPPRSQEPDEEEEHYFNGKIRFYKLAATLHAAMSTSSSDNVLFAASSLQSAANLIPLACAMGAQKRNHVHFVLMGRNDLDLEEVKGVNGVDKECKISWHDGRPDYSRWSSDYRMEVSVAASLVHVDNFIEPQVIIVDGSGQEDSFFINSIRRKTHDMSKTLIELPADVTENMMWITRLDAGSLSAWQTTYIEILIHAPPDSSGSLVRLLNSIEDADYFNYRRPHLTVELPEEVDPNTWSYLQEFIWPPLSDGSVAHQSQVTLRHRVPRGSRDSQEATAHMVESFYPARTLDSNVLILSPQVELSPLYYHYLMYTLLGYKYSSSGRGLEISEVLGISLELPHYYLNDSKVLEPPMILSSSVGGSAISSTSEDITPFLWQAPNSNAALYFGDKWMEFHSFLTRRLAATKMKTTPIYHKQISDKYPSWMEFLLEMIRVRGYTMLYPNFGSNGIVTVHNDLYQEPEEKRHRRKKVSKSPKRVSDDEAELNASEPFTVDPSDFSSIRSPSPERSLLSADLLSLFPDSSGPLPALRTLPLLSYQGVELEATHFTSAAQSYADDFRKEVGHCGPDDEPPGVKPMSAVDLFCNIPGFYDQSSDTDTAFKQPTKEGVSSNSEPIVFDRLEVLTPLPADPDEADSSESMQSEFEEHLQRQKVGKSIQDSKKAEVKAKAEKSGPEDGNTPAKRQEDVQKKTSGSSKTAPGDNEKGA